jgi:hypothetical protein
MDYFARALAGDINGNKNMGRESKSFLIRICLEILRSAMLRY